MEGTTYGYVRVSTHDQNEARQLAAMRKFGVAEENIRQRQAEGIAAAKERGIWQERKAAPGKLR